MQRGVDTYTDNLLLAVYGEPSAIASFAPSQFRLDDGTLAPGRIAEPELLAEPAFASNAVECAFYQRTSAPCAAPGAAPTAALYYGLETPLLSVWANTVPTPPICRTVTFETNQPPTRLHAFGLEGNGDLLGGCSLTHQASIVPVLVDGDADGDGVSDSRDACPSDFYNDRDGDGSCDGLDVCPLDPRDDADRDGVCGNDEPGCDLDPNNDLDADGVCAPADTCPLDAQNDADGDGLCADVDDWDNCNNAVDADGDATPDACDVCPHDYYNDSDGDGACDSADPCPTDRLNDQDYDGTCDSLDSCPLDRLNDADHDGMCADVDPCPLDVANDADGDGICENADNCPGVANADQANQDGDSYGNACEPDADNDGFADDIDNCPLIANASQADTDGDALGDACDELDDDHDGVENGRDRCAGTPVGAPVERHSGCSIAQTCSPGAPWKNHGAYVACVTKVALALVLEHRMTALQAAAAVAQAAQSNVGKK